MRPHGDKLLGIVGWDECGHCHVEDLAEVRDICAYIMNQVAILRLLAAQLNLQRCSGLPGEGIPTQTSPFACVR